MGVILKIDGNAKEGHSMKTNVLKFPKAPVRNLEALREPLPQEPEYDDEYPSAPARSGGARLLFAIGRGLRFVVFIVLYWLRLPIVGLCSIVSVVMLFATLCAWYAFPDKSDMLWGFGITSLTTFFIAWCYDYVLMKLSPLPMVDTL